MKPATPWTHAKAFGGIVALGYGCLRVLEWIGDATGHPPAALPTENVLITTLILMAFMVVLLGAIHEIITKATTDIMEHQSTEFRRTVRTPYL